MSTKLTGYVWDGCAASGMKLSSVAIMARLADFSNDEGVCWPSIETIARQIGAGMSTVRTAIGGSGMAMFAPQYNIEINNDGTNGQIGPAALKVVYDLGKKAAADFMQQQARDGGRLSGAYR